MIIKFLHPFTMIVAGPSGCGKTTFMCNLLQNLHISVSEKILKVFWCHAENNARPKLDIDNKNIIIEFINGLPSNFENENNQPVLIILDDLMNESDNKEISQLFTRGSHHRNTSVVLISQNIFHKGSHMRDISLNTKYIVLFKNPRDKNQVRYLARQIYPEASEELVKVYKECTVKPHTYLLIDLTQNINDTLRFRTEIFNLDGCICFCSKNTIKLNEKYVEPTEIDNEFGPSLGQSLYSLSPTIE